MRTEANEYSAGTGTVANARTASVTGTDCCALWAVMDGCVHAQMGDCGRAEFTGPSVRKWEDALRGAVPVPAVALTSRPAAAAAVVMLYRYCVSHGGDLRSNLQTLSSCTRSSGCQMCQVLV